MIPLQIYYRLNTNVITALKSNTADGRYNVKNEIFLHLCLRKFTFLLVHMCSDVDHANNTCLNNNRNEKQTFRLMQVSYCDRKCLLGSTSGEKLIRILVTYWIRCILSINSQDTLFILSNSGTVTQTFSILLTMISKKEQAHK